MVFQKGNIPWDKGIKRKDISGKNHPRYGKHLSEKTKNKIRNSLKGKMAGSNNPMYGISSPMKGKKQSYQARLKISISHTGNKNHFWKNGRRKRQRGYISIYSPNHPFHDKDGYVFEHRLVMEAYLGRYLTPEEIVHHINGDTSDNRPENLQLFPNQSKHTKFHNLSPN